MTTATAQTKTEKRNEKLAGIYSQIETGIQNVFTSEKWQEWLQLQSRFYRYSYANTLLIHAQYPAASFVSGFKRWNEEFNRKVKKGSKAIKILAPRFVNKTEKDEKTGEEVTKKRLVGFISVNVFDVSQTEGDELPILCNELQGTSQPAKLVIESLLKVIPCRVSFEPIESGAKGFFSHTENRIAVKAGMSDHQSAKTLAHEFAHYKMHRGNSPTKERDRKEIEAESVAFIVCKYFGVDTDDYSFEYLAAWSRGKDKDVLAKLCDGIQKTAAEMIDEISKVAPEILAAMEPAIEPTEVLPPWDESNTVALVPTAPALPAVVQYSMPQPVEQPITSPIKPGRKVDAQWNKGKEEFVNVVGYETRIPGLVVAQKPGVTRGGWMLLHTTSCLTAFSNMPSKKVAMFVADTAVGDWSLPPDELTRQPENIEWYNRVKQVAYSNRNKPWSNLEQLWKVQGN